jgi:hypothetical protein
MVYVQFTNKMEGRKTGMFKEESRLCSKKQINENPKKNNKNKVKYMGHALHRK